ncbi:DUF4276 family protein [Streptosporangium sp. DT93]|uniref:DUF4276 family protein n=1 Tax=Streptosporangium sp. DT93 TaxID=3393428 RepID=UPI003CF4816C
MLEILLEEPSAEVALDILMPIIQPGLVRGQDFELRDFQGKSNLLKKLPDRLRGYASWAESANIKFLILIDRDDSDCVDLKQEILDIITLSGMKVGSLKEPISGGSVVVRLACEELESWFFGDPSALRKAYPKLPSAFETRAGLRDPDSINGGTWERLEKLLQKAGYFTNGLAKLQLARSVSPYMIPDVNTSVSFQQFCRAVRHLTA